MPCLHNLVTMSLSTSLFIKEPGRTKNFRVASPSLKKAVKNLKSGDLLNVRVANEKVCLYAATSNELIAEVNEEKTAKKIIFSLNNEAEVLAIFVGLLKGLKSPQIGAQFLIKSSIPVFNQEAVKLELKPFTRTGAIPSEDEEGELEAEDPTDEKTVKSETDPLAGLTIIHKDDPPSELGE